MSWFQNHRQEWIAETLRVFGFIQRKHLMVKFDISLPQASADLQRFLIKHRGVMKYDASNKRYILKPPAGK